MPPLSYTLQPNELKELGIYVEDNNEDEILFTVMEFLKYSESSKTHKQEAAKELFPVFSYCHGSMGHYSMVTLDAYPMNEGEIKYQSHASYPKH